MDADAEPEAVGACGAWRHSREKVIPGKPKHGCFCGRNPAASGRVEQRRAMLRPMTSVVSALSSIVANGHQAIHTFPLPPLRFRTVGFPQYGSKQVYRWRPSPAYTPLKCLSDCPAFSPGILPGRLLSLRHTLAQWPLAPPWVLLSLRISAYYGHIRTPAYCQTV